MARIKFFKSECAKHFSAVFLLFYFCGLSSLCSAQTPTPPDWNIPYSNKNKLGGQLEPLFKAMLQGCNIQELVYEARNKRGDKVTNRLEVSAIPRAIQRNVGVDREVWAQGDATLVKMFAYAYTENKVYNSTSVWNDPSRLLYPDDFISDPAEMLPNGGSSVIYAHNCSGVINAALSASAGYSLPVASVEGALKSEYTGQKRQSIALVQGTFTSPLSVALTDAVNTSSAQRLNSLLTLWNWYAQHPDESNKLNYYIKSFNGVAVFLLEEQTKNANGQLALSANSRTPFSSVEGKITASIANDNKLEVKRVLTAAYRRDDREPDITVNVLPKPSDIQLQVSSNFKFNLQNGYQNTLLNGTPVVHKQVIAGIPMHLRSSSLWSAQLATVTDGQIKVTNVSSVNGSKPEEQLCEVEVSFTPSAAILNNNQYILRYNLRLKGAGSMLTMSTDPVNYATSRSPEVNERGYSRNFTVTPLLDGGKELTWHVAVSVNDDEGLLDWTRNPLVQNLKIAPNGSGVLVLTSSSSALSESQKQLDIIIKYIIYPESGYDSSALDAELESCKLSGTLRFYKRSGGASSLGSIERVLPISYMLNFPKKKNTIQPVLNNTQNPPTSTSSGGR